MFYLKRDYSQSKRCFEGAIENSGPNKDILRKLSMISRFVGDNEERKSHVLASVDIAKQAVGLDIKDGYSWYVLGNAHLTNFFINRPSSEELTRALKAYGQAEGMMSVPIPDLYYNRGEAYRYLERYQESIAEFQKAHELDPGLNAESQITQIVDIVKLINQKIKSSCGIKKKALSSIFKAIPVTLKNQPFGSNYQISVLALLNSGRNQGKILVCRVLGSVSSNPDDTPAVFVACDSQGMFYCLSVYNTNPQIHQLINFESLIFIRDPLLSKTTLILGDIVRFI